MFGGGLRRCLQSADHNTRSQTLGQPSENLPVLALGKRLVFPLNLQLDVPEAWLKQHQVRTQLAGSLQAIISQQLIRKVNGGRIAAIEILTATAAVRSLIREGKTHQLANAIETGGDAGMTSMDRVLSDLVKQGFIGQSDAMERAIDRESIHRYLRSQSQSMHTSRAA